MRTTRQNRPAETVAGFLAAAAIFVSLVGIAYRPLRLIPFAILISLVAVGILAASRAYAAKSSSGGTPPGGRAGGCFFLYRRGDRLRIAQGA